MPKGNSSLRVPPNTHKRPAVENLQGKSKRIQTKSACVETPKSHSTRNSLKDPLCTNQQKPPERAESPTVVDSTDGEGSNYATDLGDDLTEDDADEEEVDEDEELAPREPRTPSKKGAAFKKAAQKMALVATKSRNKTLKQV